MENKAWPNKALTTWSRFSHLLDLHFQNNFSARIFYCFLTTTWDTELGSASEKCKQYVTGLTCFLLFYTHAIIFLIYDKYKLNNFDSSEQ